MRFQVPQFIGVEDKIFWQFTTKQFVYVIGGAGISFVLYESFPFIIAVFLIIPIAGLSFALAFLKVNGQSFIFTLEAAIKYFFTNKLYIWKKQDKKPASRARTEENKVDSETDSFIPRLSESKLKEITWSLDIRKNMKE